MGTVPRKHHYVPKVLLAGFTADGTPTGTLHIVDILRRRTYTSNPEETAAEKDYNLLDAEGVDPFAVEVDLLAKKIEGPAGPALRRIREGAMPTDEEKDSLLTFIAMQALRSPSRRDAFDDFSTQLARQIVRVATANDKIFEAQKQLIRVN